MRKLASIRQIKSLSPIENADAIERAQVDGWGVVVKKGEFSPGDLCVYFEVDSLLPENDERFEFLRKGCYTSKSQNGPGFRLKTIKLRGTLSQGLVLPLKDFPELEGLEEGTDVTELLNVKKWEPIIPANLTGVVKGNFPSFVPKTDQERIQNLFGTREYKEKYTEGLYEVTLKFHGTSCTIYRHNGEFGVCSRNLDLTETKDNVYWNVARMYNIEEKLKKLDIDDIAIQGEIMGPGINGNRERFDRFFLYVFNIWDIKTGRYFSSSITHQLISILLLDHVPVVEELFPLGDISLEELLDMADTRSLNHEIAEGLVFKNQYDTSLSFKVISNKFLLSEK